MNKKIKYVSVMLLLLFARGCDFYSTSLWIFNDNGLADETNPLTRFLGVGWNGLIFVNVIIFLFIAFCYHSYIFKYTIKDNLKFIPESPFQYASILYYEKKNQLWKLFYKIPQNKNAAIAHTGYIATWEIVFASFLATIHNLLQFYDNEYYDIYLEFIKFPIVVFYLIIFIPTLILSIKLYRREFKEYRILINHC